MQFFYYIFISGNCKNNGWCIPCAFSILHKYYYMGSSPSAFKNLYKIYVVAMTLACTQVNCEKAFSKLKIIKSRLRAAINQEHLEVLMLLSIESDLIPSSE